MIAFRCFLPMFCVIVFGSLTSTLAQDREMLEDFRGTWKFQIGDDMAWADPKFNDAHWENIFVPAPWEDEGYPGYDGYAWYRRSFTANPAWKDKVLYLDLGNVDDVDEVYINGHFIAFSGLFPPHYLTAYSGNRLYPLPLWCLNLGKMNVIAVRVYDQELSGGIIQGKIGIYEQTDPLRPAQSLAGSWKIQRGDNLSWEEPSLSDAAWRDITVPAYWETQGLKGYDGFAWYRFHFTPKAELDGKQLILLLGKVDDIDETYLNGERIGKTGTIRSNPERITVNNEYLELRAYTIPAGVLKFGRENVIAVRVFDSFLHGGIYDGPVGLVGRDAYMGWKSRHREKKNPWDYLRDFFSGK